MFWSVFTTYTKNAVNAHLYIILLKILPESSSLRIGFYVFMELVSDLVALILSRARQN